MAATAPKPTVSLSSERKAPCLQSSFCIGSPPHSCEGWLAMGLEVFPNGSFALHVSYQPHPHMEAPRNFICAAPPTLVFFNAEGNGYILELPHTHLGTPPPHFLVTWLGAEFQGSQQHGAGNCCVGVGWGSPSGKTCIFPSTYRKVSFQYSFLEKVG